MPRDKKNLAFNPDTMTVADLKDAARSLRTLLEVHGRDAEGQEAVFHCVCDIADQWSVS